MKKKMVRCDWVSDDPLYQKYHDEEWGVPVKDDQMLFEMLSLGGFQAGLSWFTILKRRERFRLAFDFFDVNKVSLYNDQKVKQLMADEGIIRNRQKIESVIHNAKCLQKVASKHGSFTKFVWSFVNNKPVKNNYDNVKLLPAKTELSDRLSLALKKEGFKFAGSTICYAFMQAAGLVNDHVKHCFKYKK